MKNKLSKIVVLIIIASFFFLFKKYSLSNYLTLEYIKENQSLFQSFYEQNKLQTIIFYFVIYVVTTALSIPGAVILTLFAGALFGTLLGTLLVSFASSIGATLAFLVARFFLRDYVQSKFSDKLKSINEGIKKEGGFYLFTLRLIPLFPFFVINLTMGLTPLKTWTFYFVSQIGMLAGTYVYVNAGNQLSQIESLSGIASPRLLLSFALLGIFPYIAKMIVNYFKAKKVYKGFKKPSKFDYNMVSIGAGSAGLVTSYIGAILKAKVALIEKNKMGGDCLNTGCVPSKALIKSAKVVHYSKRAKEFGLDEINVNFDFANVMQRVQNVIKKIEPHDSIERYTNLGVECITGKAEIISPWEIKINDKIISSRNITIATGASPFIPPIKGIQDIEILTSENLWNIRELPKKFIVLGGGPIGLEMAQSFARLGSEVYVVEMFSKIMPREDDDVSNVITKRLKDEGIHILTSHKAIEFKKLDDEKILVCEFEGKSIEIQFDQVLVAVGRKPNISGFGLENLNINLRANGSIEANEYLQTNYPNIYVCGDVTGPFQLTHTAAHQAWFCAVNGLMGKFKKFKVDYSVIPWATYTDPEVATVGLTENSAKEQNINYELTKYEIDDLDRAIADNEDHGFIKVLTKPGSDKVIGCTIVGNHASDLILEYIGAMKHGYGLNKILGTIHIYPTMGEANKYLAGNWKKARSPEKILKYLKSFHNWMRA